MNGLNSKPMLYEIHLLSEKLIHRQNFFLIMNAETITFQQINFKTYMHEN